MLDRAREELDAGLRELRDLARGIHPTVLSERGLHAALDALVQRAPAPVDLRVDLQEPLEAPIEAAAYFLVSEALTNVAKYAQANTASVTVAPQNGRLLVEVSDDGVGGADPTAGTGLRGLADRIAALDGTLEVESREGQGTTVRARIPLGDA